MPALHVNLDDLHLHAIAEPVDLPLVLAAQHVHAVDEAVVVVGHRRDVHEAFDEVFDELDVEPERRHTRDVAVELVADLVRHEADLLPLDQLALGVIRASLALGRMARDLGELVGELALALLAHAAVTGLPQRPMNHQVRIAPDRRREMRVALRREAEMTEVGGIISSLLHRPEHQERDGLLFGRAAHPLDELLEVARRDLRGRLAQAVSERRYELLELVDFERIRLLVDAIERGDVVGIEMCGDGLVGEQHELFDQAMRDVALGGDDLLHHPLVVEHDLRLLEVEVYRAAPVAAPVQDLEELVHQLELRNQFAISGADGLVVIGEDRVDVGVGHACVAVDDAVVDFIPQNRPFAVDFHQAGLDEPVDVGVQAAETGREVRGKHVNCAIGKVHRRRTLVGFLVERAVFRHVVRDVGDVHAQPVVAVLQPLDRDGVVEVARVLAVDGDRHPGPEVRPAGEVALADLGSELARLGDGLLAVRVRDAVLADDDLGVDAGGIDVADDLDDLADRSARSRRPSRDRGRDHVVRLRVPLVARRNLHVHDQPAIERDDEAGAGAAFSF